MRPDFEKPNRAVHGEQLDSLEETSAKLKTHLGDDALFGAADPALRTPRAAFFAFVPPDAAAAPTAPGKASLPEFGMRNDSSIDGDHSAWIRAADGTACLMFEKRFSSGGQYEYSMLVQGEPWTEVCVFYEVCRADGGSETRTVATLTLPDKRLFRVTTHLPAEDLEDADCFRVGVSVRNGGALFDDFSLVPVSSEGLTARESD